MSSSLLTRRAALKWFGRAAAASTGGYVYYKAKYDPLHLIWDLDNTILCSVTPIPTSLSLAQLESFDQIDDDFPYEGTQPNTRTYWRPGAKFLIQKVFPWFAVQHVFTAAQETYTNNILDQIDPDRSLFQVVIHRDLVKQPNGKDIQEIISRYHQQQKPQQQQSSPPHHLLSRCILFDDRVKNFAPQMAPRFLGGLHDFQNGLHVVPFEVKAQAQEGGGGGGGGGENNREFSIVCNWQKEYKETFRWMLVACLALVAPGGDVRKRVLRLFLLLSREHWRFCIIKTGEEAIKFMEEAKQKKLSSLEDLKSREEELRALLKQREEQEEALVLKMMEASSSSSSSSSNKAGDNQKLEIIRQEIEQFRGLLTDCHKLENRWRSEIVQYELLANDTRRKNQDLIDEAIEEERERNRTRGQHP